MTTDPQPAAEAPASVPVGGAGPLAGTLVVDLSRALAGPHAAMMMADLGARVIKVESPGHGDESRTWGPFVPNPDGEGETGVYFLSCNRNKESIALDLKSEDGRAVLAQLIERADVLVENFRTGVLERLGFDEERLHELNPRLVVLSITGFGHDGPEAGRAGYDQIAQGEAGLMSITGSGAEDPQRVGVAISDVLSGMYGAYGVVSALLERQRTGRGQIVRTSLLASVVGVHAFQGTRWTVAGQVATPFGNHHPTISPYGLFRCQDGAVQIACGNDRQWRALGAALELEIPEGDLATNAERVERRDEVTALIEAALSTMNREAVLETMNRAGIAAGRVRNMPEVYGWDQTRSQGLVIDVEHPVLGDIDLPGPPLRYFGLGQGDEVTRTTHEAPPLLDEDGAAIRAWLRTAAPSPQASEAVRARDGEAQDD
ncbi:CoA transferase [Ornithinimicrobium sp. F0845]|uniref:CaiB/BaiF CoA transferase family protein n=1 Tax=Ornithinimicrobium sp. F0845 TaxID=2926412 RepID=UPI001FF41F51|nr:CoA transferase [Ornithinimicrobium sp. F0845]MCK0114223.1 CoA transferase [Ornithinimicrobium sp. F0845]